ncbi:acyltransferase family protein [Sinomicrobium sp. M5D2P9]
MKTRILSVDVLRGLTIFFMIVVNTPGSWDYVYAPLRHASWHGCTPTDLVFPSFLFVVGLSMSISMKKLDPSLKKTVLLKLLKRAALIFLIGLLLNWFPFYRTNIADLRVFGVLQRIALAFLVAGVCITLLQRTGYLIFSIAALLLGHWAILYFAGGDAPYSLEGNFGNVLDTALLGERHLYKGFGIPFDPEGLLGTLSSAGQVLLGYVIGKSVLKSGAPGLSQVKKLALLALCFILAGQLWNFIYPINKPLWTGSYVFFTTGIITALWALFIWVIDIKKVSDWTLVFRVFGQNPLASYMLSVLVVKIFIYVIRIGDTSLMGWSYQNIFRPVFDNYLGSLMFALTFTFFIWLFAYGLYRKGKIIKI